MAEQISKDQVAYVARLARLTLSADELDMFASQLAAVLEHAADVAALNLSGVPPTAHALAVSNVTRPDIPSASIDRDALLREAPAVEDGRFEVPRILGEQL